MNFNSKIKQAAAGLALAVFAAGCGGGGGSGSSVTPPSSGTSVSVFATDGLNTKFDHVWVKIYSVDLVSSTGTTVSVFANPAGEVIDLKTLRDATGARFQFLDVTPVPAGTYNSAKVVLDKSTTLVSAGSSSGTKHNFAASDDVAGTANRSQLSFTFTPPLSVTSANRPIVLDFDLSSWTLDNSGTVHAVVRRGAEDRLGQHERHEENQLEGVVSGLSGTAPNLTFTVGRNNEHHALVVKTDASTSIFNSDGSANPTIANGSRVHVTGVFVNNAFTATSVRVQKADDSVSGSAEASGQVFNISAAAGTFTMTVRRAEDFVPGGATLNVTTSANTLYFSHGGVSLTKDEFFAALANGSEVEAKGSVSGSTLAATRVKLEDEAGDEHGGQGERHDMEVRGAVKNVNADAGTFDLTVSQWRGVQLSSGRTVSVVTNSNTVFRSKGNTITRAQFFAGLSQSGFAEVDGTLTGSTVTATKASLEDSGADDGGGDDHGGTGGGGNDDGNGHH